MSCMCMSKRVTSSAFSVSTSSCLESKPENSPTFGCPGSRTSCGVQAPKDNYMDYADDICMEKFTPDQHRERATQCEEHERCSSFA